MDSPVVMEGVNGWELEVTPDFGVVNYVSSLFMRAGARSMFMFMLGVS